MSHLASEPLAFLNSSWFRDFSSDPTSIRPSHGFSHHLSTPLNYLSLEGQPSLFSYLFPLLSSCPSHYRGFYSLYACFLLLSPLFFSLTSLLRFNSMISTLFCLRPRLYLLVVFDLFDNNPTDKIWWREPHSYAGWCLSNSGSQRAPQTVSSSTMWEPVRNVKSRTHFAATATGALSATVAAKCGREELPHVRGQGQKPGGPHARRTAAKRSYPTSEVKGSGQECQAATAQERQRRATQIRGQGRRPGGATPRPRLGVAAGRSYPTSEVRGGSSEKLPHAPMLEARGGGREELPHTRGRGGGRKDQPHVQGVVAAWVQEGLEALSHVEGQEGRRWGDTPRPR